MSIRNKQRETNNIPLIQDGGKLFGAENNNEVQITLNHEKELKTKQEHCRRIKKIVSGS